MLNMASNIYDKRFSYYELQYTSFSDEKKGAF